MARLTEEEMEELLEGFDAADSNGDGYIDRREFAEFVRDLSPGMTEEELRIGFDEIDSNGNGEIDFDEFLAWWEEFRQQ